MTQTTDTATLDPTNELGPIAEVLHLDPARLELHPLNPRREIGDVSDIKASGKALGILQPVLTAEHEGVVKLLAGQRRRKAAIELGIKLPAIVVRQLDGKAGDQLLAQLVENLHRAGLSQEEIADGISQLELLEVSDTKVARTLQMSKANVKAARTVARMRPEMREITARLAEQYGLDFVQQSAVLEFENDTEALADLVEAADGGTFDQTLSLLREQKAMAEQATRSRESYAKQGTQVLDHIPHSAIDPKTKALELLADADGVDITVEAHAACPGHAVLVGDDSTVEFFCTDPKAYGHRPRTSHEAAPLPDDADAEAATDAEAEAALDARRAERKRIAENNAAARAARKVRQEHVTNLLKARKHPAAFAKPYARFTSGITLSAPALFARHTRKEYQSALSKFLGIPERNIANMHEWPRLISEAAAKTADTRIPLLNFAQVAALIEADNGDNIWQRPSDQLADYLTFLTEETGYPLSDIEMAAIVEGTPEQANTTDLDPDANREPAEVDTKNDTTAEAE